MAKKAPKKKWFKVTPTTAIIGGLGLIAWILYDGLATANAQIKDAKSKIEADTTFSHLILGKTAEEIIAAKAEK